MRIQAFGVAFYEFVLDSTRGEVVDLVGDGDLRLPPRSDVHATALERNPGRRFIGRVQRSRRSGSHSAGSSRGALGGIHQNRLARQGRIHVSLLFDIGRFTAVLSGENNQYLRLLHVLYPVWRFVSFHDNDSERRNRQKHLGGHVRFGLWDEHVFGARRTNAPHRRRHFQARLQPRHQDSVYDLRGLFRRDGRDFYRFRDFRMEKKETRTETSKKQQHLIAFFEWNFKAKPYEATI